MKIQELIGLSGVSDRESPAALFCNRLLELPMFIASFWIAASWYTSTLDPDFDFHIGYDISLWGLFTFETALLTVLVKDKTTYLRRNWLNIVIILMGLPLIWGVPSYFGALRLLRLLLLFSLFLHVGTSIRQLLEKQSLGPTLLGTSIIILMAGVMMAAIDPAINSVGDGIWWAWVTVTTVGYGDITPISGVGRAFACLLMLIGLGLFSLLTASLTAIFVNRDEKLEEQQKAALEEPQTLALARLQAQVDQLEGKIDQLINKP
jgi:voltage-gated potassium channel